MSRKSFISTSLGLAGLLCAGSLQAATITPNIFNDPALVGPGTGTDCSLRYAFESINNNAFEGGCGAVSTGTLGDDDEIVLIAGTYVLTIEGNGEDDNDTGDLDAFNDFTLSGAGVDQTTIDASGIPDGDRILDINDVNTASINGITFTGGVIDEDAGGAIFSIAGLLEVEGVRITGNQSIDSSGGGLGIGGGSALINNSTIDGNEADDCGGLLVFGDEVGVSNSTISGNIASDGNGGEGGGICGGNEFLFLANSTISGNRSTGDGGGIIAVIGNGSTGIKGAYNVTIAFNEAGGSGGGIAGLQPMNTGQGSAEFPTRIFNSIIARNSANTGSDCANGSFFTGGFNLIGEIGPNDNCLDFVDGVNGDQVGTPEAPIDPLLGPLANNGGPTQTHALLAGSPAIDQGNPEGCEALDVAQFADDGSQIFNELTADQRGDTRPVAILDPAVPVCDIGAFEFQVPEPTPTPIPTATPTPGFLLNGTGCSMAMAATASPQGFGLLGVAAGLGAWVLRRRAN